MRQDENYYFAIFYKTEKGHINAIRAIRSPYKIISYMIFVHDDQLRIVQIDLQIGRIYPFEQLPIENRWKDRLG